MFSCSGCFLSKARLLSMPLLFSMLTLFSPLIALSVQCNSSSFLTACTFLSWGTLCHLLSSTLISSVLTSSILSEFPFNPTPYNVDSTPTLMDSYSVPSSPPLFYVSSAVPSFFHCQSFHLPCPSFFLLSSLHLIWNLCLNSSVPPTLFSVLPSSPTPSSCNSLWNDSTTYEANHLWERLWNIFYFPGPARILFFFSTSFSVFYFLGIICY